MIDTIDGLTPEWLGAALGADNPAHGDKTVTSVSATPLGTGQMCDSYRVHAEHADGSATDLIAKLPSTDAASRSTGLLLRAYEKEVRFYQELAVDLGVATPRSMHSDIDTSTGSFVLLLEDMAPSAPGDQLSGCDVRDATAALTALARLHAPRWDDPSLREIEWLLGDRGAAREMMIGLLPTLWTGFVERYSDRLDDHVLPAGTIVFDRIASLYEDSGPATVVHGDYRLDNLLFHPVDRTVTVLDWQTCAVGPGPVDAAYFVGAGLLPELRRDHEADLFEHYLGQLRSLGVDAVHRECWEAYRRGTWAGLVMAVGASMLVERTERGDEMFLTMASRHARHALDLDAAELL